MQPAHKQRETMLIIGAGLGGLSTGCYAQMNGYKTHLLEMHEIPGGCCTSWEKGKFTFDWCVSWLLGSGPGNEMYDVWREIGGLDGKQIRHPEVFNIVTTASGDSVRFYSDPDKLEKHLCEISPEDTKLIKNFCKGLRQFIKCLKVYPFLKPVGLMKWHEKARMLASFIPHFNLIRKTISTLMTDYSANFKSPVLQEAFNFILYEKHPNFPVLPFYFQLASHATHSAGVPEHGSLGLARSIEARFLKLGGKVSYNTKVEEILVENNTAVGVRLSNGEKLFADIIVSASDGYNTVMRMLKGKYLNDTYRKLYTECITKPDLVFPGYFTLFLGLEKHFAEGEYCTTYILPEDLAEQLIGIRHASINVQFRNALYPELSPRDTSIIYLSYFCDIAPWRELAEGEEQVSRDFKGEHIHTLPVKRGRAYQLAKKQVASLLIDFLEEKFPGLRDAISTRDIATPLTQVRYTGNYDGSVLGWQPFVESGESLEEEVKRSGPGLPGLQNFYFSGVWATTGGLIRAATAGRHVMQFICKDDNKAFSAHVDPKAVAPTHIVLREKTLFNRQPKNITPQITPLSSRENSVASRETEPA
ncbi:phytoene desaturase family protein [Saccharophagus degradans]|uniref:NAD(P)/FAD-dependent oxidoreductase n=1 Tax=Saccharophagus degradans TaxID=86304 RepID=A0AAW7XBT1_9GAMM|nr:NAD(P)/FAD-dependent oxidoreductase [Saccharophagus degradans]MDO6423882.1 NAD(P)/FAD-dependent oxidoreductase [Saccharophagus degradans]MDO6607959.1 NAD(P)/FAD-dependent oxidoreductase [Saccharophagus degradans]